MDRQSAQKMETCTAADPSGCQAKSGRSKSLHNSDMIKVLPSLKETLLNRTWHNCFLSLLIRFFLSNAIYLHPLGEFIERGLNIVYVNGGFAKAAFIILTGRSLKKVEKSSENYLSIMGHLDLRTDLDSSILDSGHIDSNGRYDRGAIIRDNPNTKWAADLCMMASKLTFENSAVIKKVVTTSWKMSMVDDPYDFWNERLQRKSTQAFLFTDRQKDAQIIVLAFRGTEPFNAHDWCTDFYFTWFPLHEPENILVHVGFLEALGFVDRQNQDTLKKMHRKQSNIESTIRRNGYNSESGLSQNVIDDPEKPLAYDKLTAAIKRLLTSHKDAKIFITGHSLGGALATVFTAMLYIYKEDAIAERISAVYTFGQPRVGNEKFANYMEGKLNTPVYRYFRVVYSDDIVARIPFDDEHFQFQHFGKCFYYNRRYFLQTREEEPNRNSSPLFYLFIPRMGAAFELIRSVIRMRDRESAFCTIFRLMGLLLPGVVAHNPANYVNAVRSGPTVLRPQVSRNSCSLPNSVDMNDSKT
ncbi:hypothetical protein O6H91_03G109400 [Diphasiastrum complanatum]|uniref:Uncharacterized protein n=1 Tax=Diphasiastrum complanatum TaxID=34168 RepID=A0ACC2EAN1_DIPCM|nr:hypothetical protein O6H91_03G109400 [Diphasiastrum complanatum]